MQYVLEILYRDECLERREYEEPFIVPQPNDLLEIDYKHPGHYENPGKHLVVTGRKFLFFKPEAGFQTVQLLCEPRAS